MEREGEQKEGTVTMETLFETEILNRLKAGKARTEFPTFLYWFILQIQVCLRFDIIPCLTYIF